jgi:hypothetical protein
MNDPKPEMCAQEASWHQHMAGMRASAEARKQGSNPAATAALATATAGPVRIGRFTLHPASEGTVWTLKRLAREFAAWADVLGMPSAPEGGELGSRELLELGLSTLAFADARGTWQRLELGQLEQIIVEAECLMFDTPVAELRQLEQHFQKQMQAIRDLTPDAEPAPKKPQPADGNGTSPATPIPAEATDSPSSNGSLPSIPFPSTSGCGGPVS